MRLQPCVDQAGRDGIGRRRQVAGLLQDHGQRLGGGKDIRVRRNGERGAVAVLGGCAAGRRGTWAHNVDGLRLIGFFGNTLSTRL